MSDPRNNRPSASSMLRTALCPWWLTLSKACPKPPSSPDAELGTKIHAMMAAEKPEPGFEAQYDELRRKREEAIKTVWGCVPEEWDDRFVEERWIYHEWKFSGQPDEVMVKDNKVLIIDYKTGWSDVEEPAANMQLRALAVLVEDGITLPAGAEIYCGIIPLNAPMPPLVCYNSESLALAAKEIEQILANERALPFRRHASPEACRYCPAQSMCPEHRAAFQLLSSHTGTELLGPPTAKQLEACVLASEVIDRIRTTAKEMLKQDPNAIPGWTLKHGSPREKITKLNLVFQRAKEIGIDQSQFASACSLTKSALKTLVASLGLKGKQQEATMSHLIEGCTEVGEQPEPSLVRK